MNKPFELNGKTFTLVNELNRNGEPVVRAYVDGGVMGDHDRITTLPNGQYHFEIIPLTYPSGKTLDTLWIKNTTTQKLELNISNLM